MSIGPFVLSYTSYFFRGIKKVSLSQGHKQIIFWASSSPSVVRIAMCIQYLSFLVACVLDTEDFEL